MIGPYAFSGRNDGFANARLVRNDGDIIEGEAELVERYTWLGGRVHVPTEYVHAEGGRFFLDHITSDGRAVYFEEGV